MVGSHSRFKNFKRSAYFKPNGMRVNCDGTTVKDRKHNLLLRPNHYHVLPRVHRIFNPKLQGQAISDGEGWYK